MTEPSPIKSLKALRTAEEACTRCPLYKDASQLVPGEGPARAHLMMVGEQPGDQEDKQGRPFVGPAGGILAKALADAGPAAGAVSPRARSSRVTLIVDTAVVVRKLRRLQPRALFADDVIVGALVLCVSDGSRLCDKRRMSPALCKKERLQGVGSSYRQLNSRGRGTSVPRPLGRRKMIESKNRRVDKVTSVRDTIEEERERDKRKEDEVAKSSDDSFPASDPPSFTGVTSAADIERKKRANPD